MCRSIKVPARRKLKIRTDLIQSIHFSFDYSFNLQIKLECELSTVHVKGMNQGIAESANLIMN